MVFIHVRMRDDSRHQGDEGPSTDALRAFSIRPGAVVQGRLPEKSDLRAAG